MSPWNSRKARFTRFWAASDRQTRFSSSRRSRSQGDLSGRLRQNEVYPVRRLTDVALEQPQSEVCPVLALL